MKELPTDAWELYRLLFQEGEQVMALDEDDRLYIGPLRTQMDGVWLHEPGAVGDSFLPWERMVFMAECGFPARKLTGADGSATVAALNTARHVQKLRRPSPRSDSDPYQYRGLGIFDPWLIENVTTKLVNPGNNAWADFYAERDECLVMRAPDGAVGCLWDIEQVFHLEAYAPRP